MNYNLNAPPIKEDALIIDHHAHIVPEGILKDLRAGRYAPTLRIEQGENWETLVREDELSSQVRQTQNRIPREAVDPELRLSDMKAMGIDHQVLSAITGMTFYPLEAGMAGEIAASQNEGLAALAEKYPDKFSCIAGVPLQDPPAAAAELDRAVKRGHKGVKIGTNVRGENLDDTALDVFWDKVVSLDVPILLHPGDIIGRENRMKDYYLHNLISNPLDTTIAAACLMFGGVFDRFPNLKIILAHLGGFTPWIRGRWDHGWEVRGEPKVKGAKSSDEYLSKFYYDTVIHNADCLEFAVRTIGADQILYGTDAPWDVGDLGPAREIPGLADLSLEDQEKILSGNAKKLFKI